MHKFQFDARSGVLHAMVHGFWSLADADAYARDLEGAARDARRRVGHLKLLIDSTTQGVQAPEVAERLVELRKAQLKLPKDRIAVCTESPLARRQVARSMNSAQFALFATEHEARAWLLSGAESAQKPGPRLSAA